MSVRTAPSSLVAASAFVVWAFAVLASAVLAFAVLAFVALASAPAHAASLPAELGPAPAPAPSLAAPVVELPPPLVSAPVAKPPRVPLARRWWFWASLGTAAVGVVLAAIFLGPRDPYSGNASPGTVQIF